MKKSTKIITICSVVASVVLLSITGAIVFITQNAKTNEAKSEVTNYATNNYNFFNNTKINNGNQIKLNKHLDKELILYKLTNYLSRFDTNNLSFNNQLILKNIMGIITSALKQIKSFEKVHEYYINIKYEIIYNNLILDVRWANRYDILSQKKTPLYWDQLKIVI